MDGWCGGLSICYDLRFPELYREYAARGAHVLWVPSNFTLRTGRDHWEVLLRARAIENQCFVVAPDQCGTNPRTGIASYGHSLAVDPWGEILARAGGTAEVLTVTLDPDRLDAVRRRIPVLEHRRTS
ncbi:MAG: carbon-nitrogen hydrolase family protein, partial [Lentisphaerae bacterium]|nr:carbon-nitrogen hydrolase family protein [Lentisphaerota bacterium]